MAEHHRSAPDRIRLTGMQFYAYHGADPEERTLGQRFEVDLTLAVDARRPGSTDDVTDAVNYRAVYALVRDAMDPPCNLLEAVAQRIAEAVLAVQPAVAVVEVTVRKPSVPIGGVLAAAEVTLTRRRSAPAE